MPGAQDFLQQYNISRSPTPPQQFGDDINLPLAGQKRKFDGIADTACIWRPFKVRVRGAHMTQISARAHLN